jgi:hypothetical protein
METLSYLYPTMINLLHIPAQRHRVGQAIPRPFVADCAYLTSVR